VPLHRQSRDGGTGGYQEALAERRTLAPSWHSLVNAVKTSKPQSKFAKSKQCKIKPHVGLKCFRFIFPHHSTESEANTSSVFLSCVAFFQIKASDSSDSNCKVRFIFNLLVLNHYYLIFDLPIGFK